MRSSDQFRTAHTMSPFSDKIVASQARSNQNTPSFRNHTHPDEYRFDPHTKFATLDGMGFRRGGHTLRGQSKPPRKNYGFGNRDSRLSQNDLRHRDLRFDSLARERVKGDTKVGDIRLNTQQQRSASLPPLPKPPSPVQYTYGQSANSLGPFSNNNGLVEYSYPDPALTTSTSSWTAYHHSQYISTPFPSVHAESTSTLWRKHSPDSEDTTRGIPFFQPRKDEPLTPSKTFISTLSEIFRNRSWSERVNLSESPLLSEATIDTPDSTQSLSTLVSFPDSPHKLTTHSPVVTATSGLRLPLSHAAVVSNAKPRQVSPTEQGAAMTTKMSSPIYGRPVRYPTFVNTPGGPESSYAAVARRTSNLNTAAHMAALEPPGNKSLKRDLDYSDDFTSDNLTILEPPPSRRSGKQRAVQGPTDIDPNESHTRPYTHLRGYANRPGTKPPGRPSALNPRNRTQSDDSSDEVEFLYAVPSNDEFVTTHRNIKTEPNQKWLFKPESPTTKAESIKTGTIKRENIKTEAFGTDGPIHTDFPWSQYLDPAPRLLMHECSICGDYQSDDKYLPPTWDCPHEFNYCSDCLEGWISSQLETVGWERVSCPHTDCRRVLDQNDVQRCASAEIYDTYMLMSTKAALGQEKDFRWCLRPGCQNGQIHESGVESPIFVCFACGYRLCVVHDVPWHEGETCQEYNYRTDGNLKGAEEAASADLLSRTTKNCPRPTCNAPIEKTDGCDHMTCSSKPRQNRILLTLTRSTVLPSVLLGLSC